MHADLVYILLEAQERAMKIMQTTTVTPLPGESLKMKVNLKEMVVAFDVDDTLVMWDDKFREPHDNAIAFHDPNDNSTNYLTPHKRHIEFLKKQSGRGFHIIVWSGGGVQWAASVIRTLGLEEFVDDVFTKPSKYVDDLQASEILGSRIYLKDL